MNSDNDNEEEEYDEVVADVEWDVLEGEDTLTGTHSSMQGPFLFHVEGSESMRLAKTGQTIGPSLGPVGGGRSATTPRVPVEGGGSTATPHELIGVGGSTAVPEVPTERGGSAAAPSKIREMSPPAQE